MEEINEIWKPVVGWEGLYECSNMGRVKSVDRYVKMGKQNGFMKGKIKTPTSLHNGYLRVNLCKDGKYKTVLIHRIVAMAFPEICGEWFEGCECDHINGERTDNRAKNIKVVNKASNMNNPITKIKMSNARKGKGSTKNGNPSKIQLDIDGRLIKVWESAKDASDAIGCSRQVINDCCANRCKTAFGFVWKNYSKETYLIGIMNNNIRKGAA